MNGAFDFETYEWTKPLCCALRFIDCDNDRNDIWIHHTRNYNTVSERALEAMAEHPEVNWYAHNMGKYDGLFLSAAAMRLGWYQKAKLAGGNRVICFEFRKPGSHKSIRVYDTFALVPDKLKKIAEDFDLPSKKEFTEEDYKTDPRTWPLDKLKSGCFADCQIVLELLDRLNTIVQGFDGKVKITFSSTALGIVKAKLKSRNIEIPNCNQPIPGINETYNQLAYKAYYGARVEVYHHTPKWKLIEYDINSSYPHAMRQEIPWIPIGLRRGVEADSIYSKRCFGVCRATVVVPDMGIPPLPYRPEDKEGIFFPVGTWESWFPAHELYYAESLGCSVEPHEFIEYEPASPFTDFIDEVYSLKQTAKGALRRFAKDLLNGCYGKWSEKPEHSSLLGFATMGESKSFQLKNPGKCTPLLVRMNGEKYVDERLLCVTTKRYAPHAHYALGGYITAYARISLHRYLIASEAPVYCDSDSIHCRFGLHDYVSAALGALKVEAEDYRGEFFAPKIYRMRLANGKEHFASKGFPVERDAFELLLESARDSINEVPESERRKVHVERMRLLKSQFRSGGLDVARIRQAKSWRGFSMKRRPLKDGSTVPWSVDELRRGVHKSAVSPGLI